MAYQQEQEGTWLRYTYFRNRDTTIMHNTFGLMAAFASVPAPAGESWPKLHYSFNLARRSGRCDRIKVFMHSYREGATVVFNVNDTISDTLRNLPSGYSVADYRHVGIVKELKLHFNLPEGGRIYGISFESYTGLQVDNIAMRGSSGLIFSKMDRQQQEAMMGELSPSLILLQFGGNVVPYMNARYYRREFEKELAFFKEICPGIPIIVIGPADMSVREKGEFKTYPGLEKIRDALKHATLESGFAFWDLYEAMGGYNSMPSFVHSEPPLASTDYVHFNGLGINLVAEMFYNALMREYERFSQTSHP
jgi:lysophospholipase L1-like esterase